MTQLRQKPRLGRLSIAGLLLVAALPVQLAGFLGDPITSLIWLPMIVFEVVFALWLLIKGVAPPARTQSA